MNNKEKEVWYSNEPAKNLHEMECGDMKVISDRTVLRVVGGWLWIFPNSVVLVPNSNEFKTTMTEFHELIRQEAGF